jgi:hypothetical protein
MCRYVLYTPAWRGGRACPVVFAKVRQQREQMGSQRTKAIDHGDLIGTLHERVLCSGHLLLIIAGPEAFRATDEWRNVQTVKMGNGDYIPR